MKKKKKLILGIGIGIISVCIVTIVSILIFFPVYLNSSKMKKDYVESMTDDKMWKIYLIPDSYGFIRGYVVSQASKSPEKIKIWTKEDGTVFRTTKKIHTVDGFDTPEKKYILKNVVSIKQKLVKIIFDILGLDNGSKILNKVMK